MILKRYFVEGLAHASYLFGAGGEAAVVDPKRDVDDYIADAKAEGLKITAIFNTHPHADFASGFIELADRTGAKIYISHLAPVTYERVASKHGDKVRVGNLEVEILETPGHSPDSSSFLVREQGKEEVVFTGDLLFVNDVGRPDLRDADEDPLILADKLYDSLFDRILNLPDEVKIYPAHGAGSLCGRAISSAPFSFVGQERKMNWAAQITDRSEFVRQMVSHLPERPAYFSYEVGVNLKGSGHIGELPALKALREEELKKATTSGAYAVDTRSAPFFGAGHFPGSLNIGLGSALFSTWLGFLIPGGAPIALVVGSAENAEKARLELLRIGYDNVLGYIVEESLQETLQLSQLSVCDLKSSVRRGEVSQILDVRTFGEWKENHIEEAIHIPLPQLPKEIGKLKMDKPIAVICGSGYRSTIAASLLLKEGAQRPQNVMGGMGAYLETKCPNWQASDLLFVRVEWRSDKALIG